jgi:hypothetical protein
MLSDSQTQDHLQTLSTDSFGSISLRANATAGLLSTTSLGLNDSLQQSDRLFHASHFPSQEQPLIGVIDTGFSNNDTAIDYSRVILGRDYIDGDSNPLVSYPTAQVHGSNVLEIIADAQNQASLWLGRVVGSGKWAESLVEFVDTAKVLGQPHAIANLSFDLTQVNLDGSTTTRYELTSQERTALEYARQNGVLVVAAAGNTSESMSALGQASQEFDNLITVGAAAGLSRAEYSSYGDGLTLVASSENLLGTSGATAEVTGSAAQVWAANPYLSYQQVTDILKTTATDLGTPGWDVETGFGLLNPASAIHLATLTNPISHEILAQVASPNLDFSIVETTAFERPTGFLDDLGKLAGGVWNGVTDVAGFPFKTAGKAIKFVTDKTGDGLKLVLPSVLGNSLNWFFDRAGEKIQGNIERELQNLKKFPSTVGRTAKDLFSDELWKNTGEWFGRNLVNAVELSGIPARAEALADLLKFNTRALTANEKAIARSVFGDSINLDLVRIDEWSLSVPIAKAASGGERNRPFTTFHTINTWGGPLDNQTLIHELVHVWQYEHVGAIYIPEALAVNGSDAGYNYGGVAKLQASKDAGRGITSFNPEQAAEIVEDYYRLKHDDIPNDKHLNGVTKVDLPLYAHFVDQVSTLSKTDLLDKMQISSKQSDRIDSWILSQADQQFVGDFNRDGKDDIFIRSPEYAGLFTFNGTKFQLKSIQHDWVAGKPGVGGWNISSADQHFVGDFNGDGKDDIFIRSPEWAGLLTYNGANFQVDSIQHDWVAGKPGVGGWNISSADQHFVGDFNGDGKDDIFIRSPESTGLLTYNGTNFQVDSIQHDWVAGKPGVGGWNISSADQHFVGDFNGDGKNDIFIRSPEWAGLLTYNGTNFQVDSIQYDWVAGKPGASGWNISSADQQFGGDFNGDGKDDIFIRSPEWAGLLTYNGTNFQVDSIQYDRIDEWNISGADQHFIGDFNKDGNDDVFIRSGNSAGMLTYNRDRFQLNSVQSNRVGSFLGSLIGTRNTWNLAATDQHFVGDFSGTGKDDIFTRSPSSSGLISMPGV